MERSEAECLWDEALKSRLLVTKAPLTASSSKERRDRDRQSVRSSSLPFKPLSFYEAARKKLISAAARG